MDSLKMLICYIRKNDYNQLSLFNVDTPNVHFPYENVGFDLFVLHCHVWNFHIARIKLVEMRQ